MPFQQGLNYKWYHLIKHFRFVSEETRRFTSYSGENAWLISAIDDRRLSCCFFATNLLVSSTASSTVSGWDLEPKMNSSYSNPVIISIEKVGTNHAHWVSSCGSLLESTSWGSRRINFVTQWADDTSNSKCLHEQPLQYTKWVCKIWSAMNGSRISTAISRSHKRIAKH